MNLRPKEIKTAKYWIHVLIIVVIVFFLINWFIQPMTITLKNTIYGMILIGVSDITAHSLLGLD